MMARRSTLVVLALSSALAIPGCSQSSPPSESGTISDPPHTIVAEALRFGALAPLPPESRVVALFHEPFRDPYTEMAIRMPSAAVEPFLIESGMGRFDPYASAPSVTVFDTPTPESAPSTPQTRVLNDGEQYVARSAAAEPEATGTTLLHVWLLTS